MSTTKPPTTKTNITPVPKGEWPGAWAIYKYSRDAVKFNLTNYVLLLAIPIGVNAVLGILKLPETLDSLLNTTVSIVFSVASTFVILEAIKRNKVDYTVALKKSWSLLALEAFGLQVLSTIIIIASLLFFIVPFFFIAPRISLALYYLIDKRMGIIGSLQASWAETKGHVGKVYGIVGAIIAMALLCLTIVGIPFSLYFLFMYTAALPVLYMYIKQNPKPEQETPSAS